MTWVRLAAMQAGGGTLRKAAISLSGKPGSGRTRPTMFLTIHPQLLVDGHEFRIGASCEVMIGEGDHAGQVRVELAASGAYMLFRAGGRAAETMTLRLPWLEGVSPSARPATTLTFQAGRDWLEASLPSWAKPGPAASQAATLAAANAARGKAGYVGVTSRVPDPAATDRARQPRNLGA